MESMLVMITMLVILSMLLITGCSIKICECNSNSPKTIKKVIDRNSSESQVFTVPRGI